jgi:hypothetical protein
LQSPTGEIVGASGLGLRRLKIGDQVLLVGVASDFAVDQEHRSVGPALMLQRAVCDSLDGDVELIYGLPNSKALGVFRRVGYKEVGVLKRYVKVLRSERYLRSTPIPSIAHSLAGAVIDRCVQAIARETWRGMAGRTVKLCLSVDARFDELWRTASPSALVAVERNSQFVAWRLTECPLRDYALLTLSKRGDDRLLGYAACCLGRDRQAVLVDLWANNGGEDQERLLTGTIRWARAQGAASMACELHAPELENRLRSFGFKPRGTGATIAAVSRRHPLPAQLQAWPFLLFDEDYN